MAIWRCGTLHILPDAVLLLLLSAASGTAVIRIATPIPPSVGPLTCKGRVLHVRAAIASSSSMAVSGQIAVLVDGQQLASIAARQDAEVPHPQHCVTDFSFVLTSTFVLSHALRRVLVNRCSLGRRGHQGYHKWRTLVAG